MRLFVLPARPRPPSTPPSAQFHSVCLRLLRAYGKTLGLGANFGVVDRDDQQRILRRAMDECKVPAVTASGGKMLPALGRLISYLQFKGEREWTHASIRASAAGFSCVFREPTCRLQCCSVPRGPCASIRLQRQCLRARRIPTIPPSHPIPCPPTAGASACYVISTATSACRWLWRRMRG